DNSYKVLIAGGWDGTKFLDTAEVYDTRNKQFSLLSARMTVPRSGHTAVVLSDGRIVLAGGYNGANTENSMEVFDPASQTFSKFSETMVVPKEGHLAATDGGRILLAYGFATYSGTPQLCTNYEVFGISPPKRLETGYVDYPRILFASAVTSGGTIAVCGGVGFPRYFPTTPVVLNSFEVWRFSSTILHTRFTVALSHKRAGHRMVSIGGGKLLVVGGYDVNPALTTYYSGPKTCEIYDDRTPITLGDETISDTGSLSRVRFLPIAGLLGDGRVLIAGGADDNSPPAVLDSAEIFDPSNGSFSLSSGNLLTRRYYATQSMIPGPDGVIGTTDDRILVVGGLQNWVDPRFSPSAGDILSTAEIFIP
ncbi:MAG: kelch repeat-containing protein, partial [Planctomycetota bacterium]|nr:kelch repeat-containing protein [Planctomycetota bacterium]